MKRILVNLGNTSLCSSWIHDAVCEAWAFEYAQRRLTLRISCDGNRSDAKSIIFEGVYAQHMVSCAFWGASPYIFGLELIEPASSEIYKQLMDEIVNAGYDDPFDCERGACIEARLQFTSGDVLTVLCRQVMIEE